MTAKLYAIVPLLNEELNVPALIDSLAQLAAVVQDQFTLVALFVDDGSTDGTITRLTAGGDRIHSEVLRHGTNLGPGAAFATGFTWLHGKVAPDDWVVTMEGDSTSRPEVILHMLQRRLEGYDVVLASPYMYGGGFSKVSVVRILLSQVANGLVKLIIGVRGILTFSCFLRLYSAPALTKLQRHFGPGIVQSRGFEAMVELLGKMILVRLRISEVEMHVDWTARKGKSKLRIARTIIGYIRLFGRWKALSRSRAESPESFE